MERLSYDIRAGDFTGAGHASRSLKQHLKRIGADAEAVRRAMIAAYEAEMNVVIHTEGGALEATVADDQLDVEVVDHGPGMPDVDQAMRDGFSTASAEARALGFGAGMGLPNILRNSDRLRVTSAVGQGTRVSFSIVLSQQLTAGEPRWSLAVRPELCRDCRRCLTACPTSAVRVRDGAPSVLQHLCIDCTCCLGVCPPEALTMQDAAGEPAGDRDAVLVVPPAVLAGFHPYGAPVQVLAGLRALGYGDVVVTDGHEEALRRAVGDLAAREGQRLPVVSPVCPAAVKLIELRFPALIPHVAPFASPLEAAQLELGEVDAAFVVSCPSQRSALLAQRPVPQRSLLRPAVLRDALLPSLTDGGADEPAADDRAAVSADRRPRAAWEDDRDKAALVVTGASHVIDVLERLENGLLADVPVVEPYLCDGGCFGSPLLGEDPHLAAWRWSRSAVSRAEAGRTAHDRTKAFKPRPGIRLDADMAVAIRRLAELDQTVASLPGKDCGVCGAPTCAALAEDIVMGRAVRTLCPYVTPQKEGVA